jgi:hypothetical protein
LFFNPGRLTREYIDGKRVRHVAPLPLYLFLMFFVFSMTAHFSGHDEKESAGDKAVVSDVSQNKSAISDKQAAPASSAASTVSSSVEDDKENATAHSNPEIAAIPKIIADLESDSETHKSTPHWLQEKLKHAAANPELVIYKMKGSASKFALLLLPLALPVMWLLFPFSRKHLMFDHCVFILYSLSFAACAMMILSLMSLAGFAWHRIYAGQLCHASAYVPTVKRRVFTKPLSRCLAYLGTDVSCVYLWHFMRLLYLLSAFEHNLSIYHPLQTEIKYEN